MSLSVYALGQNAVAGFKVNAANDWNTTNTGVALGSGDAFELRSSGVPRTTVDWAENDRLPGGVALRFEREKRREWVEGVLTANLAYRGCQRFAAGLFGADAVTSLGSGAYSHLMTLERVTGGLNWTLAWTDNLAIHDVSLFRVEKLTYRWEENTIASVAVGGVGKRELTDGTGANGSNLTTFNSAVTLPTQPSTRYQILSSAQTTVRLNLFGSAALGAGADYTADDVVHPNAITLDLARSYKRRFTSKNLPFMDEPIGTDWIEVSGTLSFPIWEYVGLYRNIVSGSRHKLDIKFVGATIGGAFKDQYLFEFPAIDIDSDGLPDLDTPDLLEIEVPFQAHTAVSNPTGMAFATPRLTIQDATATSHIV